MKIKITIEGPPGSGKTRLLQKLAPVVAQEVKGFVYTCDNAEPIPACVEASEVVIHTKDKEWPLTKQS